MKKGANKVASLLLSYPKSLMEDRIKHVYLFCDNYAGQNCNPVVYAIMYLALHW